MQTWDDRSVTETGETWSQYSLSTGDVSQLCIRIFCALFTVLSWYLLLALISVLRCSGGLATGVLLYNTEYDTLKFNVQGTSTADFSTPFVPCLPRSHGSNCNSIDKGMRCPNQCTAARLF